MDATANRRGSRMIRTAQRAPCVSRLVVLRGHSLAQFLIHSQRAVSHAKRLEDFVVQEIAIAFARHPSHHVAENPVSQVRVVKVISRRPEENAVTLNGGVDRSATTGIIERAVPCIGCKACGVSCHPANRRLGRDPHWTVDLDWAEVLVHRMIEVQLATFLKHHEGGAGERLGDRGERVRCVRRGLYAILPVGATEALLPQNFSTAAYGNRNRWDGLGPHLVFNIFPYSALVRAVPPDQSRVSVTRN